MFRPMKPETIKRRAKEHREAVLRRRIEMVQQLEQLVKETPGFIWEEMLQEARIRLTQAP